MIGRKLGKHRARAVIREGGRAGDPTGLQIEENAHGCFAARIQDYPLDYRHGALALGAALEPPRYGWDLLAQDEALAQFSLHDAVFVDIETTGLRAGAGTQVFLIGLGRFEADRFVLWQGFLRDPKEEPALLEACAQRLVGCSGMVSFFGKSFDRHRLHERFAYWRRSSPFLDLPHLDLYWLCRRLQPRGAEDGKLRTMEGLVAGVEREQDLPGSEAPAAWFAYQRGQPHLLEGVFAHHRDDVLSLLTLAAQLGRLCRASSCEAEAALLLARCLHKRKDERALSYWAKAWTQLDRELRRSCAVEYATMLRRAKDPGSALEVLEVARSDPRDKCFLEASLERIHIHRTLTRDYDAAQREFELAQARLFECGIGWVREQWQQKLNKQAERLRRARSKSQSQGKDKSKGPATP